MGGVDPIVGHYAAQSLRFELFNRAGRIARPHGATVLRLSSNHRYRDLFTRTAQALKAA